MHAKSILSAALLGFVVFSCAPKKADAPAASAAPAPAAVAPAEIKDTGAWIASYSAIITEYQDVCAKLNGGNSALMGRSQELVKAAADLDAVAETLKASLSGQALADFTAKAKEFKDKFAAAATS